MSVLKNKLFTLFIAFISAVLMVMYVYSRVTRLSTNTDTNISVQTTKVVEGVPITIVDTSNSKYVSGLPETVNVTLNGPRNILAQMNAQNIIVRTSDFAYLGNGEKTITLEVSDLPASITGEVDPKVVVAQVTNLVNKTVKVTPVVPEAIIAQGYTLGVVSVEPETVVLSGSQEVLDEVDNVSATVSSTIVNRMESFVQNNISVVVKDSKGNILDVHANKTVNVSVSIIQSVQNVPVKVSLVGQSDAYTYEITGQSVTTTPVAVSPSASSPATQVDAIVDVSGVTVSSVLDVPLLVRDGETLTKDKTVRVSISVTAK